MKSMREFFTVWLLWRLKVRQTGQMLCVSDFLGLELIYKMLLCIIVFKKYSLLIFFILFCFLKIFPVLLLVFLQMPVLNPMAVRVWRSIDGGALLVISSRHRSAIAPLLSSSHAPSDWCWAPPFFFHMSPGFQNAGSTAKRGQSVSSTSRSNFKQ